MVKLVKVFRERGYAGIWEVAGEAGDICHLVNIDTKQSITLYKAHTFVDSETIKAQIKLRNEREATRIAAADMIGRNRRANNRYS